MQRKRYRERLSYGARDKNKILLRIILTVALASLFSVLFCMVGITLGKNAVEGLDTTTPTEGTTAATEEEITSANSFAFKEIENIKAIGLTLAREDRLPYNTVQIPLTDGEGKLMYLSSVSAVLYGSSFSTTLKPITAAVNSANIKSNAISVSFRPFELGENQGFADSCTMALIKELCDHDINEIVLERHDISDELAREAVKYVSEKDNTTLGIILPDDVLSGIISEKEKVIRKYYTLFDFCVIDTAYLIFPGEDEETDASFEEGSEVDGDVYENVYSVLNENTLLIAKYSLRIRLYATDDETLLKVNELIERLDLENYEIIYN